MPRFVDKVKADFLASELQRVDTKSFGPIYFRPVTLYQQEQIDSEQNQMRKAARAFQVRALDAEGKHLVAPNELDDLMKHADGEELIDIALAMQKAQVSAEDAEKN
jgi:hypothetical protein